MDRPEFDAKLDFLREHLRADREAQRAEREAWRAERATAEARAEAHAEARHQSLVTSIERTNARIDTNTLEVRSMHIKHAHDTMLQIAAFERANSEWRASTDTKYAELKGEIGGMKTSLNMLTAIFGISVAVAAVMVGYIQYELTATASARTPADQSATSPR